jgi:hypothetical protein
VLVATIRDRRRPPEPDSVQAPDLNVAAALEPAAAA